MTSRPTGLTRGKLPASARGILSRVQEPLHARTFGGNDEAARGVGFARAWRDQPRLCDDVVSVQGRTVDSVFALASSAEARRGLYVDVTRAREDVTIAYAKDEGGLWRAAGAGAAPERKVLVRDAERNVGVRVEREQQREREQKRLRSVAIEQEHEPKIDRKHDQSRGRGMSR